MKIHEHHKGSCHCGRVQFEVHLPNGLEELMHCDCSICRKRGSITASVPLVQLIVTDGVEYLTLYQFHSMTAKHYFCSVCGIYTHHQRRSDPSKFCFNVGCLDGVNPFELGDIYLYDGINHPSDQR